MRLAPNPEQAAFRDLISPFNIKPVSVCHLAENISKSLFGYVAI